MDQDKLYLVNKLFNNENIRTGWDKEQEKYFISVVDLVGAMADSKDKQAYWRKLKQRLKGAGNESVTNCNALKLKAADGKYRMTDVVDIQGMFRIIESLPSKNVEPIKEWLAKLGNERLSEIKSPSLGVQTSIDLYRDKGYDEQWIATRMKGIQERKKLTDVWKDGGITDAKDYAILTNEIYKTWSGMTAKEYKSFKGLRKESLRDNMDNLEVSLTDISEEVTKRLARKNKPHGLEENLKIAHAGGQVAKNTRDEIESLLGQSIISKENKLNYQYIDDSMEIENKEV